MNWLSQLATQRLPWLILCLSAILLEAAALYFQYAMGLDPCIKCVYQRTAVFGILLASAITALNPNNILLRLVGLAGWGISAVWGAIIAYDHVIIQTSDNPFLAVCGFVPEYPGWMPLHEWFPAVFNPTGMCGEIDWTFMGFSMPVVMLGIFIAYSAVFALILFSRLIKTKAL